MRTTLRRLALPLLLLGSGALPVAAQSRAAAPVALRGDVNGDGQVTVLDALAVLAFVVGKPLPAGYAVPVAGDADGSGTVSTMDALVIAGFAAGRDVARFPVGKQMPAVRADAVECAADARSATLTCGAPRLLAGAATQPLVVGGQDVYVRLTSRNTHFNDTTRILSADVRVTNLLAQTLGLEADGTPSPDGVRVFFNNIHSSGVSVMDVDGEETFLAPNQVFYQYAAALAPGDSTPLKTWRWHLPDGVNTFTFRVYATGAVQYPGDNTNQADLARDRDEGVTLNLVSGGGQTGPAGQPLPQPVVVRVLDVNKQPLADRVVNFLAGSGGSASPVQTRTDSAGYARTTWTLGPGSGAQELRVSGTGGTLLVTATTGTPAPVVASVRITPDSLVLLPGDTGTFTATAYDAGGAPVAGTATWTTADSTIARVSATGRVTAVAVGTVQITATIAGVSASARVRVKPVPVGPVVRVVVSPDTFIMYPNQRRHFTATAYDAAGHVVNAGYFRWSSSDSTYVKVDLNGYVLALG
ncbi:MAG TPA: Ig-like domain-containing protein, partial [Longimicrobiaceae bacterium]|nr:Ig-like domain-containing protein [Longimicrobiaceae bacterium]